MAEHTTGRGKVVPVLLFLSLSLSLSLSVPLSPPFLLPPLYFLNKLRVFIIHHLADR
jgi:hypothetical protein